MSIFPATAALKEEGQPVYIHLPCLDTVAWGEAMEKEYGNIGSQGCDRCECGPDGNWREVRVAL